MKYNVRSLSIRQIFNDVLNNESGVFSFLRFSIIGSINTVNYYILYILLLGFGVPYVISHSIAFILSMIGSYFLNCIFTFKTTPTLKKFLKYPLTTLANYIISTVSLVILVKYFHIDIAFAALLASIAAIPITFLVTRHVLKKPVIPVLFLFFFQ